MNSSILVELRFEDVCFLEQHQASVRCGDEGGNGLARLLIEELQVG